MLTPPPPIQVVSRIIGTGNETIVGAGHIELMELHLGLTRQVVLSLNQGGDLNLRLKALDFGLPQGVQVQASVAASVVQSGGDPFIEVNIGRFHLGFMRMAPLYRL